ncbi:MAG: hypothetical protein MZV64_33535 [Ignavibacteriales bacterium]|nr:hypothetical protein [Ignavibacteriales bacterium]
MYREVRNEVIAMKTRAIIVLPVLLSDRGGRRSGPGDIPLSSRLSHRDITLSLRDGTVVRGPADRGHEGLDRRPTERP